MKITKLGHSCLLINVGEVNLLTDPGNISNLREVPKWLDAILISHEHTDHFDLELLKKILGRNPKAEVITNKAVGALLAKEAIDYRLVESGDKVNVKGVEIEAFEEEHAKIYKENQVQNTGFLIAKKLFTPGDAFVVPGVPVEILALPVSGPWLKTSEVIDYALAVKPQIAFPVHDGFLALSAIFYNFPARVLGQAGIKFDPLLSSSLEVV